MKNVFTLLVSLVWAASTCTAGTVFVGFKDNAGANVDYDYNDLVFSLSSNTLQLNSSGVWEFQPSLNPDAYTAANAGLQAVPFWNNTSLDGAKQGIGWCIYGGGACNGGVGLDPTAEYLTSDPESPIGSVNDVSFSSSGSVGAAITLKLSMGTNVLGWYNLSDPTVINWINSADTPLVTTTFAPSGPFGLVAKNSSLGETFYSTTSLGGTADSVSHFAFFADSSNPPQLQALVAPTPEPSTVLLGLPFVGLLAWRVRKQRPA